MKTCVKVFALSIMLQITTFGFAQSIADTIAIKGILHDEVVAWNIGNAENYSQHFAEDGTFTNILGSFFIGHHEFLVRHHDIFKGVFSKTTMKQSIVSLKFLDPNMAIVETITWISGFSNAVPPKGVFLDENGNLRTRLLQVMVKKGEVWKIVAYHNVDIKPGIPVPDPL